jgi:spore germination protein KA
MERLKELKSATSNSADLIINELVINGVNSAIVTCDGLCSPLIIIDSFYQPLTEINIEKKSPQDLKNHIMQNLMFSTDRIEVKRFDDVYRLLYSGFAVLIIEGVEECLAFGIQGYPARSISEPSGEGNIMDAKDGFVESARVNMSLIRRRMKSPLLKFELMQIGEKSQTDVFLCYFTDKAPTDLVDSVKKTLQDIKLETVLASGYIRPFLEDSKFSLFDNVSTTERPDVLCAKVLEGRVAIIIDGTPFTIIVPRLITEIFQTMDDYNYRPYYALYIRLLKYFSALIAVFFPAVYVAAAVHHQQWFDEAFFRILNESKADAAFPITIEALIILFMYEIIREAGLRLPKLAHGAVSIVAGLILGQAAVDSGFMSIPMLTVCALSIISTGAIPELNQSATVVRPILVILGGMWGFLGVGLGFCLLLLNLLRTKTYGFHLTSPLYPLKPRAMKDVLTRKSFKKAQDENFTIDDVK